MGYDEDEDYEFAGEPISITLPEDVLNQLANRAARAAMPEVQERATEMVRKLVDGLWDATLKTSMEAMAVKMVQEWIETPRQCTDTYGKPNGQTLTFQETILLDWKNYMSERVNYDGTTQRNNYGRDDCKTRFEYLIQKLAVDKIEAGAKAAITSTGDAAREAIKQATAAFIAQHLAPKPVLDLKQING
jgi:hypothetical protein